MIPPLKGRVSSPYGNRTHPVTGVKTSFHNGVDIAVPIGTPIVAPQDGKVTEVWNSPKGGKCLAMVAADGTRYGFAHLSVQAAKTGQAVKQGEVIAMSGNTGASTGPHLHFTVKKNGMWHDPQKFFKF